MYLRIYLTLMFLIGASVSQAADVSGDWHGELAVQPKVVLPLVLHLQTQDDSWQVSLDSPAQGAFAIPGTVEAIDSATISLSFAAIGASYEAQITEQQLTGTFAQAGRQFPLNLNRHNSEQAATAMVTNPRPQEPKPPFGYAVEEVSYAHISGAFDFAATLTLPTGDGPFAAAILVSGSGPQDRDETLMGHKPFWVLADHLTKAGIAVLRFDDRGTAKSGGEFNHTTIEEFSTDVESAYAYLRSRDDILPQQIGVIGHSEGGMTAPLFAARQPEVAFVVLLAGLGIDGKTLWAEQQRDIASAYGNSNSEAVYKLMNKVAQAVIDGEPPATIKSLLLDGGYTDDMAATYTRLIANEWGRSFFMYQPQQVLAHIRAPILALNGTKDLQVSAESNLAGLTSIFNRVGHKDATVMALPEQNHLFQQASTGLPSEYATITQTIAPQTLSLISEWLIARVEIR